nr:flagellar biosynthetic protein FliO [candidate division Zixibacteria bacterium]
MSTKNKKLVLIIIVLIISAGAYISTHFDGARANTTGTTATGLEETASVSGDGTTSPTTPVFQDSVAWSLIKLLGALVVVVAGIYGFVFILRRMMGRKFSGNGNRKLIEVIETTYLEQKKSISLVRFYDRAVLVGSAESGINILAELNPEETAKILALGSAEKMGPSFRSLLKAAGNRMMSLGMGKAGADLTSVTSDRPQTV